MSFAAQDLFNLLPAVHRIRDARLAEEAGLDRGPLEELIDVFAQEIAVMAESLNQTHDDLFIETCADWVVPYIGDLIGYESLHSVVPEVASPRAEVAHTIALRRRKGTALVLEQLARDVTGWDAKAVEYFQRLCWTQYMKHIRPQAVQAPDMRQRLALEWIGTAFETANRTVDVRHIASGGGRHNIPNVGVHLWRIRAYPHRDTQAAQADVRLYRISPLNHDMPIYNRPLVEREVSHLAGPENVPLPLSRRRLSRQLALHYGVRPTAGAEIDNPLPALQMTVDNTVFERDRIRICNLSDDGPTWAHTPPPDGFLAVDPVLGRIALPGDAPDPATVRVRWQEGAALEIGGGEYGRGESLPEPADTTTRVRVPDDETTIAAALTALGGAGVVEITDSSTYPETLTVDIGENETIEIRAADGHRPFLDLAGFTVTGAEGAGFVLNGCLIAGAPLEVPDAGGNALERIALVHCTLVPGITLSPDGLPVQPDAASLSVALSGVDIRIERSIVGTVLSDLRADIIARDSIIDGTDPERVALAAMDGESPGAAVTLEACTVIGKVHAREMPLVSNSILLAALADPDTWRVPVRAERKQQGCVRFSWLPLSAIVPQRFECQPETGAPFVAPDFTSRRYGTAAYGQLTDGTPMAIRNGADDGSEMGATHMLYATQREINLNIRLREYTRVGLDSGIFYES
ncbi:hypothetical protein Q5Y75_27040 [Ruegeria sp. 2205SS24-7]|uniref:hypothetical protein n=1 Tax=Ruegeria discodermiae TaxID=3064389 RepID=UPI002741235D|nr:hypothetical protein [Ruegeria sp. 2205SS24-7]MDP5220848.1 hypothetical protein [Ruegeria sp. 2205SS24-7]